MKDKQFGELTRDRNHTWVTAVSIPYFRNFGTTLLTDATDDEPPPPAAPSPRPKTKRQIKAAEALGALAQTLGGDERQILEAAMRMAEGMAAKQLPADEPKKSAVSAAAEPEDALDGDYLFRQGKFRLNFDPGKAGPPSAAQRAAWDRLVARGDAAWDEVMAALLAEYRLQRPIRARWWKAMFGDRGLRRALPELKNAKQLAALLCPLEFRVRPPAKGKKTADAPKDVAIGILWAGTWNRDGFGVLLRDGRLESIGRTDMTWADRRACSTLEHPTFGTLRRAEGDDAWDGFTRVDAFKDFCQVAGDRAKYNADPEDFGVPRSEIAWEFARGEFELKIYAPGGAEPTAAQAKAWERFLAAEKKNVDAVVKAVFDRYQKTRGEIRRKWEDDFVDELVPKLKSPNGLREVLQLRHVHVFPEDKAGGVMIGLQLVCSWDYDSVSVRWRDGKVQSLGTWDDATPTEAEMKAASARAPARADSAPAAKKEKDQPKQRRSKAGASGGAPAAPAWVANGPVKYDLKVQGEPSPNGSTRALLTSPMLDATLYKPGPLTVDFTAGPGARSVAIDEPFQRASLEDFLRNQVSLRRTMEAELAKDLDRYDPDESFGRDNVWDLARVEHLLLEPRRVVTRASLDAFARMFKGNAPDEDLASVMANSGDRPETRATFCLLLKVDWDDEDRMVWFRDGRVAEYRVGY